ncbi:MAG TPA: CHAP domain-containing protein [Solirubrobacteraceae bacterium]|nr:CHAP domain-containing protein [Solirubrobacteraceae bacterium]
MTQAVICGGRLCPERAHTAHAHVRLPLLALLVTAVVVGLGPAGRAEAGTLPAAPVTALNVTPDCPVSASVPECSWNVPSDPANVFGALDYGECPYWAAEKYPALVLDDPASDPLAGNWNGGTWIEHAQTEGLPLSATPAPGDLAVWQPRGIDPSGHVAYVEVVLSAGIIVSQMDGASAAPFPPMQGSTEYISNAALENFVQTYHLAYVVTGDRSTTPLAYLERPAPPSTTVVAAPPTTTVVVAPPAVTSTPVTTHRSHAATRSRRRTRRHSRHARHRTSRRRRGARRCGRMIKCPDRGRDGAAGGGPGDAPAGESPASGGGGRRG